VTLARIVVLLRRWGGPLLAAALFAVAARTISGELAPYRHGEISRALSTIPGRALAAAMAWTGLSYALLLLRDLATLRSLGIRLSPHRSAFVSFVAYAFSHTAGLAGLTGASVRFRFYSVWGLRVAEIGGMLVLSGLAFWFGFAALGGAWLVAQGGSGPWVSPWLARAVGAGLLAFLAAYLGLSWFLGNRRGLRWRGHEWRLPAFRSALLQIALSAADWIAAAAVLWTLLPGESRLTPGRFLGAFLVAQAGGVVSQVPAGLGVFESLALTLLGSEHPASSVAAALIVYRLIYYLGPLVLAAGLFSAREASDRWPGAGLVSRWIGRRVSSAVPILLTMTTFASGVILLVSGATPSEASRLRWLRDFLPLPALEVSHFLGSLAGAGLLLLARGLQQRLDAAYTLTAILLGAGAGFSLAKGGDYEEAVFLLLMLALLLPCRKHFYRRASLLAEPFTPGWIVAVAAVVTGTAWISAFAHRHVEYVSDLWWTFALHGDASRSLRALAGVIAGVLVFGAARLLRPAFPQPHVPTREELDRARRAIAVSSDTAANLALLGDKALLFSDSGDSVVMYSVVGGSFVAMGDPVGRESELVELAWRFHDLADRHGGHTVFYEVSSGRLPLYLDMGLALVKLGEEGRVRLERFSIQGNAGKPFRHTLNALAKEGYEFEIVSASGVEPLLPELRRVSDAWLAGKNTREKGFSLGYFDEDYLREFPAAVVRRSGRVVAFANLWITRDREESSVDLMRFGDDAPRSAMDYLLLHTILWAQEQGYRWFNLGMAPLSGVEARPRGPVWSRVASFVYRHGEHFYNFQGLRAYKEKFSPEWKPRYLAFPGRLAMARVLLNVASLTSRGLKGAVSR